MVPSTIPADLAPAAVPVAFRPGEEAVHGLAVADRRRPSLPAPAEVQAAKTVEDRVKQRQVVQRGDGTFRFRAGALACGTFR